MKTKILMTFMTMALVLFGTSNFCQATGDGEGSKFIPELDQEVAYEAIKDIAGLMADMYRAGEHTVVLEVINGISGSKDIQFSFDSYINHGANYGAPKDPFITNRQGLLWGTKGAGKGIEQVSTLYCGQYDFTIAIYNRNIAGEQTYQYLEIFDGNKRPDNDLAWALWRKKSPSDGGDDYGVYIREVQTTSDNKKIYIQMNSTNENDCHSTVIISDKKFW